MAMRVFLSSRFKTIFLKQIILFHKSMVAESVQKFSKILSQTAQNNKLELK